LELAKELNLPVILHNREATEDILSIVKEIVNRKSSNGKCFGVFHCFNGSHETVEQILKMGFYVGIGGVLTFKNSKLAEKLDIVPINRLLLETDAPYMAPVPHRGERNESRFMMHVAEKLAEVYNCPLETILSATNANAKQLFLIK